MRRSQSGSIGVATLFLRTAIAASFGFHLACGPGLNLVTTDLAREISPSISYLTSTYIGVVGTALTIAAPTTTGSIASFSASPALPAGLTINTSNGAINGTPTARTSPSSYQVTGAAANAAINLEIKSWGPEAYLKAPNAASADFFGRAVAISGDTLVVGADGEDSAQTSVSNGSTASGDNSAASAGAVYVFRRSGTAWAQEAYIKAPNAEGGDFFGNKVAISGDTIVVGAYFEASNQNTITNGTTASGDNSVSRAGAVYVFRRTGTTWAQEAYLKPPFTGLNDDYGFAVAIDADTIVVGAQGEDGNQNTITNGTGASSDNSLGESGAAYVYKRTGSTWTQEAFLKAPNLDAGDSFGIRVAISGDTVAVAASSEDSNQTTITNGSTASGDNTAGGSGAVYVFKRTGSNWAQEAYIKASNSEASDSFGTGLALDSDTLIVGASAESSSQTTISNGIAGSSDNSAANAGAAYVFKRTGATWVEEAYLKAPNAENGDRFGVSVGVSGDRVVVGSRQEDSGTNTILNGTSASADNSVSSAGAAYVFKRTGSTWAHEAYVKPPEVSSANEFYGEVVAISGSTVLVGAINEASNQTTVTNGPGASPDNSAASAGAGWVVKLDSN